MKKSIFFYLVSCLLILILSYEVVSFSSQEVHQTVSETTIDHAPFINKIICLLRTHEEFLLHLIKLLYIYSSLYLIIHFLHSKQSVFLNRKKSILFDRSYIFSKRSTLKSKAHPPTY